MDDHGGKVMVVYASRSGHTAALAAAVAQGVEEVFPGQVFCGPVAAVSVEELLSCRGLVVGSPTYFRDMMEPVKQFFFRAEQADLAGKPGGAFTTFGWNCEALPMMLATMEHILGMKIFRERLAVKGKPSVNDLQLGTEYGRRFAAFVGGGNNDIRGADGE